MRALARAASEQCPRFADTATRLRLVRRRPICSSAIRGLALDNPGALQIAAPAPLADPGR